MLKHTMLVAAVAGLVLALAGSAGAGVITIVTDFELGNPGYTDGYGPGFQTFAANGSGFDTTQGWTFYISYPGLDEVNPISVPLAGGGSVMVGELEIREGYELKTNELYLSPGTTNTLALRSQTLSVEAGGATADWVYGPLNTGYLNGYYSQDDGSSWTPFTKGENFTVATGTLQILLARNAGLDINPSLDTVTVSYVPEPATLALMGLGGLGLVLGRKRR